MKYSHPTLAAGRWNTLTFCEQMANVGSEVIRAIGWQTKDNAEYVRLAFYRALELLSLTKADQKNRSHLSELSRNYEVLVDYFAGTNEYHSTADQFNRYFSAFTYAARVTRYDSGAD